MPRLKSYEKLFIYTVQGDTPGAAERFGDALLARWEDSGTTLLFFESPHEAQVKEFVAGLDSAEYLSETEIDYENWEAGQPITARRIAGFLVCPTWDMREPEEGEIPITLDPGVAFGTGFHATTFCCLEALREIFSLAAPRRILDLGCGTGILSIAALRLGASHSTAVDYTTMATDAARVCLDLNGVADRVTLHNDDVFSHLHHDADLVISNIYLQVIEKLFDYPEYYNRDWLLISGIHGSEQHDEISALIDKSGRKCLKIYEKDTWFTYLTKRNISAG